MAPNIKQERVRWVAPIAEGRTSITEVTKVFPYGKRTLERWLAAYKRGGAVALEPRSTRLKTSPRETPIRIKEAVIALRKKKRLCALKLHWKLEKAGIHIHERTIGKILKAEKLVRKYRTKKISYKYLKVTWKPGELMEKGYRPVIPIKRGRNLHRPKDPLRIPESGVARSHPARDPEFPREPIEADAPSRQSIH